MVRYFDLEITVTGPILTKGSEPGDPGLDAVTLRAPDGSLVINGKHIHGRCRHAALELAELAERDDLRRWATSVFGPQATQDESERGDGDWKPARAQLNFEELRCARSAGDRPTPRDFRLPKDEFTETGEDRMLAVFERAGEHGEPLQFAGKVRVVCKSEEDAKKHQTNLLCALRWLTSIGGEAGVGYGLIRNVVLRPGAIRPGVQGPPLAGVIPDSVDLRIKFAQPFCLAAPQLDENIFRCLDYLPGGALAGAVQRALGDVYSEKNPQRFATLREHFNRIRFRHAFPLQSCFTARPIPTPWSWVHVGPKGGARLIDAALVQEPSLFKVDGEDYVPQFRHDWKTSDGAPEASAATGFGSVDKELRTYTEIERATGIAKDKRLYSYELVQPQRTMLSGERETVVWSGAMDIADVPAEVRCTLFAEFCELLREAPLLLGKTDARATLCIGSHFDGPDPEPIPEDHGTDCWIVTLASDTLLLDVEALAGASQTQLEAAYRDAWAEMGNGLLTLRHYFSEEKLVGGNYLYHRFRDCSSPSNSYFPYLITGAGTIFVLTSKPTDVKTVQDLFHSLLQSGLPLGKWAEDKFGRKDRNGDYHPGNYWENCPFIPQNGFGEIVVNHPAQIDLLHSKQGVDPTPVNTVVCQ